MKIELNVKQKWSFFWLRGIRSVRIDQCCAKCFIGKVFNEIYEGSKYKESALVSMPIPEDASIKAYYLCGMSLGYKYDNNMHIAFVPDEDESIEIETDRVHITISGAREIKFQEYAPAPEGEFTQDQLTCRNWIFANYLKDDMPL